MQKSKGAVQVEIKEAGEQVDPQAEVPAVAIAVGQGFAHFQLVHDMLTDEALTREGSIAPFVCFA